MWWTQIINALEVMLPEGFDFTDLEEMFSQQIENQLDYGMLILSLLDYFIRVTSDNLVKLTDYCILESQTQKLEAEIRNHIKIEQSVKIYLEIKLRSLEKYKKETLERRLQVSQLNYKLSEQDQYYRQLIQNLKQPQTRPPQRVEDSGRTTLQANFAQPPKSSYIHRVDEEEDQLDNPPDDHDQLDDLIAQDLQNFRFYNERVNNVK